MENEFDNRRRAASQPGNAPRKPRPAGSQPPSGRSSQGQATPRPAQSAQGRTNPRPAQSTRPANPASRPVQPANRSSSSKRGGKYARKPVRRVPGGLVAALIAVLVLLAIAVGAMVLLNRSGESDTPNTPQESTAPPTWAQPTETEPPTEETTLPEPEHEVAKATVSSTGDILMHMPVVDTGLQSGGGYNFDSIFQYLGEYSGSADYAVANLETTLCGTDNGFPYKGYPNFNCPDEIVDALKNAGFDMLLTANNHSYDTTLVGYKRTLEVVRGKGLATLGTYLSADETKWTVQEINGIKIGMLCYTYADAVGPKGNPRLNLNSEISESGLCNFFLYDNLGAFYTEVQGYLDAMKEAGAEATIMYIHWGIEYQLTQNSNQSAIAQKLCDMGIDVIVGGHPHVVQPIELLTSTEDPNHKTVCLYSMGNAVSNQRQGNLSAISTAHTEDGVLFSATFSKYSDGTVYLDDVSLIPCWVNLTTSPKQYVILPLDNSTRDQWQEKYQLGDTTLAAAQRSYDRTIAIVGDGLSASQDYLAQQRQARDDAYEAAIYDNAA